MRRLRQDDPELYELKLFEWDYMASLGDDEVEPDLDVTQAPEIMFTIGETSDEPATAATSETASQLRGGAHHQSSILGTAGNYKIYSGHERAGSGGTAGTRQYPVPGVTGTRKYSGLGNIAPSSTRTAGTPGLRTSTGARQQLGQTLAGPWPSQGNITDSAQQVAATGYGFQVLEGEHIGI